MTKEKEQQALKKFLSSKMDLQSYIVIAKDSHNQWHGYYDADIDDKRDSISVFEAEAKLLELLTALSSTFKMIEQEIACLHKSSNTPQWVTGKGVH